MATDKFGPGNPGYDSLITLGKTLKYEVKALQVGSQYVGTAAEAAALGAVETVELVAAARHGTAKDVAVETGGAVGARHEIPQAHAGDVLGGSCSTGDIRGVVILS